MRYEIETKKHISNVRDYLEEVRTELKERGRLHDWSKLSDEEAPHFRRVQSKLAELEYGSKEYSDCLKELKPALDNHYSAHRHHPEHFENGIREMNLLDLIEMLADWKAATLRHNDGDLKKSIEINQTRFGYSSEFKLMLQNTAEYLGWIDE